MKSLFSLLTVILFCQCVTIARDKEQPVPSFYDGPYIIYDKEDRAVVLNFDAELNIYAQNFHDRSSIGLVNVSSQEGGYEFSLMLHETIIPPARYDMPERMLVISDPHGDIVPFVTVLQGVGVIDNQFNWAFEDGHLIILGDVCDRGDDVTAIYWLIYKLEEQALKAGGRVHFLIGNHEVMTNQDNLRYVTPKYLSIVQKAGVKLSELWNGQTELGRWISSCNQMEIIGDILFVHAGVSPQVAVANLSIEQINDTVRKYMLLPSDAVVHSPMAKLIMGADGTLWYRGLINTNENMNEAVLNDILNSIGVKKIIVGHTMIKEVSAFFDGRVIDVNVNNKKNMKRGTSRGVFITPHDIWPVDGTGRRLEFVR